MIFDRCMALSDRAADVLYPIFHLFGWEWRGDGVPSRRQLIDHVEDSAKRIAGGLGGTECGRILVQRDNAGGISVYVKVADVGSDDSDWLGAKLRVVKQTV